MKETNEELARGIVKMILYITIATASKDNTPWNSPVYSAFDEGYNFYWMSPIATKHSKNIKENPKVSLVIYDSTVKEGTGKGVYKAVSEKFWVNDDNRIGDKYVDYRAEVKLKK